MNDYELCIYYRDGVVETFGCPADLKLPYEFVGAFKYEGPDEGFRASIDLEQVRSLRVYKHHKHRS